MNLSSDDDFPIESMEGGSSNTPSPETTTGGEDWLSVSLYLEHGAFPDLSKRLDEAQRAAKLGQVNDDADIVEYWKHKV